MNNKHKHAGHIITIEGHSFKSNESGMWNLTEIWKILGLPNNKLPSQWRGKVTKRLTDMQKMHVEKIGIESITYADVTNGAIVIHTQRLKSDPGGNLLS